MFGAISAKKNNAKEGGERCITSMMHYTYKDTRDRRLWFQSIVLKWSFGGKGSLEFMNLHGRYATMGSRSV